METNLSVLDLKQTLKELKHKSGNHSPSIKFLKREIPQVEIKIDACFLSNPYATELFMGYFNSEIVNQGKLRDLLEFYPSQNNNIAEALGGFFKINPGSIFIGNGAIEIIQAIIHNYTQKSIVINIPTFSSYHDFVKPGIDIHFFKLQKSEKFVLDTERYIEYVKQIKPDTVVIINPNNPDGGYLPVKDVYRIVSQLDFVKNIIIDESFIHFAFEDESLQITSSYELVKEFKNVIIIKSLSKDFGIAGVRAGYSIMDENRVSELLKHGFLWNSNGIAEYFFDLYCRPDFASEYNKVRIQYIRDTQDFLRETRSIKGFTSYPSYANFALLEIENGESDFDVFVKLLVEYCVYVRPCKDKIGLDGEYIRVSSRKRDENEYVLNALKSLY
jgi:histidinol-phosphate/aromatic aminotransferase/cobyric acid decarboxylase-like protein